MSDFQPYLVLDGSLPIHARADEIVAAIQAHPVVILAGETGSGKTTQLPKLLLKAGLGVKRPIVVTQPRRVAALSLARRVSEEMKADSTSFVGHKVRFDNRTRPDTRVIFATDGTLLAELGSDPDLRKYDAIVVDEAHERSLNVDFLLGVLQRIRRRRPDLRIVIASATIDTQAFAKAFCDAKGVPAPVMQVEGRSYPVDVLYRDELVGEDDEERDDSLAERTASACRDMMDMSEGDLLCFLPGEKEIRETMRELEKNPPRHTEIVPLFGRLSASDQDKVFHPGSKRRIILSTNVAETSVTVPRIRMVVDTGVARLSRYTPRTRTKRLQIEPVSQASARQRAGRCGRIAPGICLRMYSREDFDSREQQTAPEVQRADLSEVILRLLDLNLGLPEDFPFLDPPDKRQVADGWQLLRELTAVDDDGRLTEIGKQMARLPLDPRSSRIVLEAAREKCLREVIVLAAGLSIPDPREFPEGKEDAARNAQRPFADRQSDFLSLLNLYEACQKEMGSESTGNKLRKFCQKHFLSYMRMRDWREAVRQISSMLASEPSLDPSLQRSAADYGQIHRSILAGFLSNICRLDDEAHARLKKGDKDAQKRMQLPYRAARGRIAHPWPGSVLVRAGCDWMVAAEIVETTRTWARSNAEVDPLWIEQVAGDLVKREYGPPYWDDAAQQVACGMRVLLWGLPLAVGRRGRAKDADPVTATECFCRDALVDGRIHGHFAFLDANIALRERVRGLEERIRRRALYCGEEAEIAWYASRLPTGLSSTSDLQGHLKANGDAALRMTESDLLSDPSALPRDEDYPSRWKAGGLDLPLTYRFAPEDDDDGVTLTVPEERLDTLPDASLEWVVPGLLAEKIEALFRAMARDNRQKLSPLPDSARRAVRDLASEAGRLPLREALSKWMATKSVSIRPGALTPEDQIPVHLRMRLVVVDAKGRILTQGREAQPLRDELAERTAKRRREMAESLLGAPTLSGLKTWPKDLVLATTEEIRAGGGAMPLTLFPALSRRDDAVEVRRFPTPVEAARSHQLAVRALLEWNADGNDHLLAWLPRDLQVPRELALPLAAWTEPRLFVQGLCESLRNWALEAGRAKSIPRDAVAFAASLDLARQRIRQGRGEAVTRIQTLLKARQVFEEEVKRIPAHRPDLLKLAELTRERLWPAGFPANLSWESLARLPAWWTAATRRIKASQENPKRDQERALELSPFVKGLAKAAGAIAPNPRVPGSLVDADPMERWGELAFALEEYRVQTWAQDLGTAIPASLKRIQELFAAQSVEAL